MSCRSLSSSGAVQLVRLRSQLVTSQTASLDSASASQSQSRAGSAPESPPDALRAPQSAAVGIMPCSDLHLCETSPDAV